MIYLDNNATTCPSASVLEEMSIYLNHCFFNPSSSSASLTGADKPRAKAALAMTKLLNAEDPECFTFTSGATESNNWILSTAVNRRTQGTIVISSVEHASVREAATFLAQFGCEIREVSVDSRGVVKFSELSAAVTRDTVLVSIMSANNETGVLQPIDELSALTHRKNASTIFHTDATQAVGKLPIDLQGDWCEVDAISFSGHKFHGPKGVGGLYLRPGIEIPPLLRGGGQEGGRRAGTTNTPGLAGLSVAADESQTLNFKHVERMRDDFELELKQSLPKVILHSTGAPRLANTSCFSLPGFNGEELAMQLARQGIIVGTGSACSSGSVHPPKTLLAMDVEYELAQAALRVSLSRHTRQEELDTFVRALTQIVKESA